MIPVLVMSPLVVTESPLGLEKKGHMGYLVVHVTRVENGSSSSWE